MATNDVDTVAGSEERCLQQERKPQVVSGLDHPASSKPLGEQSTAVLRQQLMVVLANLGVLSAGMCLAVPSITLAQLTDPREHVHLTPSQASWYASINTLTTPLGGLLCGYMLDRFGRKSTLYSLNISAIVAWALMAFAYHSDAYIVYLQLLVSRFIIGVSGGLSSAPASVYSAEISLPKIRGRLVLGTSLSIASGITLTYVMGYFIRNDWHMIGLISLTYQLVALVCVIPIPETPSWLISKGRIDEAKASLNYFRGVKKSSTLVHPEIVAEFNTLQKSIQLGAGEKKPSFVSLLRLPEVYKPLLILFGLFVFQQMTGIFVIIVYAVQIAEEAGGSVDPFLCAIMIGLARVISTCPLILILEKWGRRGAGLVSASGMGICMMVLAFQRNVELLRMIPHLPVIAIVAFIVLSTLGLYTLPFFMISELFPQSVRGAASGLSVAVGLFLAFICIKTYPSMRAVLGLENCFLLYGLTSFAAVVFIYYFLPETRGRTLLEIEESFRGKNWRSRKLTEGDIELQEVFMKGVNK